MPKALLDFLGFNLDCSIEEKKMNSKSDFIHLCTKILTPKAALQSQARVYDRRSGRRVV